MSRFSKNSTVILGAVLVLALLVLHLEAQTTHTVTLNWLDSVNPAGTTYNAYRKPEACTGTAAFVKINTTPITAKSYTDAGVAPGIYCYHVTAVSAISAAESTPSNTAGAVAENPIVPPSGLTITVAIATVTVSPAGEMVAKLEVNTQKPTQQ